MREKICEFDCKRLKRFVRPKEFFQKYKFVEARMLIFFNLSISRRQFIAWRG